MDNGCQYGAMALCGECIVACKQYISFICTCYSFMTTHSTCCTGALLTTLFTHIYFPIHWLVASGKHLVSRISCMWTPTSIYKGRYMT